MAFDAEALLELETRIRELREEAGEELSPGAPKAGAGTVENSAIKQVREAQKAAEKRAKEAEARVAELEAFKTDAESKERMGTLTNAGLSPRQAEVFLKSFDEVNEENVQMFKSEVLGLGDTAQEGGTPEHGHSHPGPQPFAPTGFTGERSVNAMGREEFEKLYTTNPAKAIELFESGGVDFKK
jgi:hypothetical protein